uniref:Fe2OG dioxygenase domain-containing protein n=1 Tax=Haptolina ericina TaxID=156174 RepID=A0A6T9KPL1_9EUKA|mmetsp:Transcript_5818/g.12683  ORF Transcript_5818/g.12683 Transcript_5818/m.12683 type:complete len:138 (+) Transcript_5818:929-1342(+)
MHKDETALTFNLCLSPNDGFSGGGTYFPASANDVDGILLRPNPGHCLVHDGNIKHAGNEVLSGERFILVGFYNADGRDRAGEEQFFNKRALEEARAEAKQTPPFCQTIYFTTAVATSRGVSNGSAPAAAEPALPAVR